MLRWTQRDALRQEISQRRTRPTLSRGGKTAALGLGATAVVLLVASALDIPLGLATAITGAVTAAAVLLHEKTAPWNAIKNISWGVLPLVAGLFVLVEALDKTGLIGAITACLSDAGRALDHRDRGRRRAQPLPSSATSSTICRPA